MRVVPLENEDVNECWIADRDRFSYEALNSDARLTQPMIKQGGQWQPVDWNTALGYVADGLKRVKAEFGAAGIGALGSAHSTVEELHLLAKLVRGLGSENIDHRVRHADFGNAAARRQGALARHLDRLAVARCRPRWSSARSCARTTRCSRSACARRRAAARRCTACTRCTTTG